MLSTGMSTEMEIEDAIDLTGTKNVMVAHSTSAYPCDPAQLNLNMIRTLINKFDLPIGYSGHETGLAPTLAAVSLGATFVERHVTLDRAMWGSDHAASVEPQGIVKLVRDIRCATRKHHSAEDKNRVVLEGLRVTSVKGRQAGGECCRAAG